ncbi:hypothetical protein Pcinc_032053 [Petrolisthes cinctipes]|uniref:Uncharacterized protein n=1 Tax=Petrolisthes cinctipes TaxID=88211 RepID=A0AAE1EV80_PETCI|nr:hypothetical protein Pcinc_032053 [Petrolisthes cinctipes]
MPCLRKSRGVSGFVCCDKQGAPPRKQRTNPSPPHSSNSPFLGRPPCVTLISLCPLDPRATKEENWEVLGCGRREGGEVKLGYPRFKARVNCISTSFFSYERYELSRNAMKGNGRVKNLMRPEECGVEGRVWCREEKVAAVWTQYPACKIIGGRCRRKKRRSKGSHIRAPTSSFGRSTRSAPTARVARLKGQLLS